MRNIIANRRIRITKGRVVIVVMIGLALFLYNEIVPPTMDGGPVFDGESQGLKATKVVPTLDAPIQKGMNTIWCASFLSLWKSLQTDLAQEPLAVQGAPEIALALNNADDPRPHIPQESLYVATGMNQDGMAEQIRKDLAQRFPTKVQQPTFPEISPNSFVAYAYLEANINFSLPYFQNNMPLTFTDSAGNNTNVSSFGIRSKDESAYYKLRRQPAILYASKDYENKILSNSPTEFVIDLDHTSKPNQIILANVKPQLTLAKTLESVEEKIARQEKYANLNKDSYKLSVGSTDVLLVPDIVWRLSHRFAELEGREFKNTKLKGQRIDIAQQDIQFRLDRSGADLKSEAKMYLVPIATYYLLDRPFLLYMKKRGAEMPYLVMWVDNAELLNH